MESHGILKVSKSTNPGMGKLCRVKDGLIYPIPKRIKTGFDDYVFHRRLKDQSAP